MNSDRLKQAVAILAMVFAVGAAVAIMRPWQRNEAAHAGSTPDYLNKIEQGQDHIEAATLAAELMAGHGDVALVDLRPEQEFAAWHLPGAVNLTVPAMVGAAGVQIFARSPRLVVLCSNGPAHPGQAWVELQRQGASNVKVLDGGLDEFKAKILTPPSLQGADEAQSKSQSQLFLLRRAFFLGNPAPSPLQTWATDPKELTAPTLVSPSWLQAHLDKVTVLDVREKAEDYQQLHIRSALHLPVAKLRQRTGDRELHLLPADELAAKFGALGIERSTPVVVYAQDKMHDATLAALALLRCGHRALAILEGGLLRWATERRPLDAQMRQPVAARYEPVPNADDFTVDTDQVAAAWRSGTPILDVRPADAFAGTKVTEARGGHIPGAKNRLYSKDLERTDDGHYLRPRADLEKDYTALGLAKDKPMVVHCRTGHTASETYFVLRHLLGYEQVRYYNGSWTEWAARPDLPAATGDGKNDQTGKNETK